MNQQNQIQIGIRLAALRKEHGLSQEELAFRLAVSRQAISKWERGESLPDTENLIALSRLYEITLDELINGAPSEEPKKSEEAPEEESEKKSFRERRAERRQRRLEEDEEEEYADLHYHDPLSAELMVLKTIADFSPILISVIFLLWGFFGGAWHVSWTLYLLVPVFHSLYEACLQHRVSHFAFPILITFLYLLCGLLAGLWHPLWVIYTLVPPFYALASMIDRATRRREAEAETDRDRKEDK